MPPPRHCGTTCGSIPDTPKGPQSLPATPGNQTPKLLSVSPLAQLIVTLIIHSWAAGFSHTNPFQCPDTLPALLFSWSDLCSLHLGLMEQGRDQALGHSSDGTEALLLFLLSPGNRGSSSRDDFLLHSHPLGLSGTWGVAESHPPCDSQAHTEPLPTALLTFLALPAPPCSLGPAHPRRTIGDCASLGVGIFSNNLHTPHTPGSALSGVLQGLCFLDAVRSGNKI